MVANKISRSLPISKSRCGMSNGVSLVDHFRNSSSFSDSKHFVCSTCHKCVFTANHDNCVTKLLKEVNYHAKVQSTKTRNNNKPVEPKSHTQKPGRQIAIGQRFSLNKSSDVHEKPNTPRSCLRWIPTGRIFKLAGHKWIPTRKMFTDSTTKVDSEPLNGSNDDITNPYECNQTLNVNAGTLNLSAGLALHRQMTFERCSSSLGPQCQQNEVCPHQFRPRSSTTRWRLQSTLQAPLLKEKKSVRFSALYLQKKRNLHGIRAKSSSKSWLVFLIEFCLLDTMADVNVDAPANQAPAMAPHTRTDEQILLRIRWVPIGKSNCYLDVERSQNNPIYKIAYDKIAGCFKCQLDEQWFDLTKYILRDALQITPVDSNNAFSSPPTPDALIKFVNDLGYLKVIRHLYEVVTNDMFQPWRALTMIINLCLTGNTLGFERPTAPVWQILWGVINQTHIDYAERMREEFTQSIHTFIEYKKNLAQHTQGKKKATLIVILSDISRSLQREQNGKSIPNELITDDIQGTQYYNAYLEKVAKHQRYLAGEEVSDPDSPTPKPAKVLKKRKPKSPLWLIDEFVDKGVPVNELVYGDEEADTQRAIEASLKEIHDAPRGPLPLVVIREPESRKFQPLPDVPGKGKEKRCTPAPTEPLVHEESSSLYAELGLTDSETDSDDEVSPKINPEAQDEGQAGPNLGIQDEGQARSNLGDATEPQP
ncbi:hypothetical protein Tco_1293769 [Tanacetum coccineum]